MAGRTCRGFTQAGTRCRNPVAADRVVCGRCQGLRPGGNVEKGRSTLQTALTSIRDQEIGDGSLIVAGSTSQNLADRPTPELVAELRDHTQAAVASQARMFAVKDLESPAYAAAADQATTARRNASRFEDAVKERHPDPYGAALATSAWETAGGVDTEPARIRRWLADTPTADVANVHRALNTIAQHDLGTDKLAEVPWVDDLNRAAAYRASALNNPGSVNEADYNAAQAAWRAASPAPSA